MIGTQLGHYKIISQLGRGGMASVFKAEQAGLGRLVAIKILQPSLAADEVIVQRFQQEARIAANLHHAHIVTIYDVGEVSGTFYIAMRFIDGENLGQLLRREGPLEPQRAMRMLEQVASALDFAHSRGVLHRDIKPANVMVEPGDVLTLTDFGIARAGESSQLTATHMVIGTPEYMSPEQARGDPIDRRSDIYAMGVLMYEALGGRPPFNAASTPALLYMHVHEPPQPLHQLRPDLPRALSDVISRALAKDPNDRPQSAQELVAAARAALTQGPATSAGTSSTVIDPNLGQGGRPPAGRHTGPAPVRPTPPPQQPPVRPTPPPQQPPSQQPRTPPPAGSPAFGQPGGAPYGPPPAGPYGQPAPGGWGTPAGHGQQTHTLTPPPIPQQGMAPGQRPAARPGTDGDRMRSSTWILGPIAAAVALLLVGMLVVWQFGIIGASGSATPTPTAVAAKPVVASTPTSPPAATPTTAQAAPKPTEVPAEKPAARPAETPAAKPAEKPTQPPPTNTPAPPQPTATPDAMARVTAAQGAVAAGDFPAAINQLRAVREDPGVKADPATSKLVDETLAQTHIVYGNQLLEQNKLDESYGQFGEALKLVPNQPEALDGQKRVILTKNYAIMEANWGKDDDAAIKALEENMILDPEFKDTRQKLYALLLGKADALLAYGDRNGAFPILMRALEVLPQGGEAQKRLATYTPTPAPQPTPVPQRPQTQPQPQPQPQQPQQPFRPSGSPV